MIGLSNLKTDNLDTQKYKTLIINKNGYPLKPLNKNEFARNIYILDFLK